MTRISRGYVQFLTALAIMLLTPSLALTADPADGATPPAAGKQLRVKSSLEIKGSYQNTGPVKHGTFLRGLIDNSYTVEYVVPAETILTGLQKTNPMDPASQKERDEYNAKVKARADQAQQVALDLAGILSRCLVLK
jgi:hypothetical protein